MALNIAQIDEYVQALIENSKELLRESKVLYENKAFARSYTLSHIAREEIAKCKILYAAGRRLVSGVEVDWKITMKRLCNHKAKLKQETVGNSVLAAMIGDEESFDKILNGTQASADLRNDNKNNSLYVDISGDGSISAPSVQISKELAERNIKLAEHAVEEEISFQDKVGKLSGMNAEEMPNIDFIDNLGVEEKKELLKNLSSMIVSGSRFTSG